MSFSAIDGYAVYADIRCGSDGSTVGVPELAMGSSPEDQTTAKSCWDTSLLDGFDSGWVDVELDINSTGSIVWFVDGKCLTYDSPQFDEIQGVIFRAGVSTSDGTVSFRNLSGQFFRSDSDSQALQTASSDDGSVSTVGTSDSDCEDIVVVAPDGSGFQKARIFAQVRMQSPDLPNPTDLFAQFFIYATPHTEE
jgi:hypothetical protein